MSTGISISIKEAIALANNYYHGQYIAEDKDKAIEILKKCIEADNPDPEAYFLLTKCYRKKCGNCYETDKKIAELYIKAANLGHNEARFALSRCYEDGIGVKQNMKYAVYLCLDKFDPNHDMHKEIFKDND